MVYLIRNLLKLFLKFFPKIPKIPRITIILLNPSHHKLSISITIWQKTNHLHIITPRIRAGISTPLLVTSVSFLEKATLNLPWSSLRIPPSPHELGFPIHDPSTIRLIHQRERGLHQVTPLEFLFLDLNYQILESLMPKDILGRIVLFVHLQCILSSVSLSFRHHQLTLVCPPSEHYIF